MPKQAAPVGPLNKPRPRTLPTPSTTVKLIRRNPLHLVITDVVPNMGLNEDSVVRIEFTLTNDSWATRATSGSVWAEGVAVAGDEANVPELAPGQSFNGSVRMAVAVPGLVTLTIGYYSDEGPNRYIGDFRQPDAEASEQVLVDARY
jgi:hypothetical protein